MMTYSKKGNAFVEAALVFPITVLAIMSIVAIVIFLFHDVSEDAKMIMAINQKAGIYSETYDIKPAVKSEKTDKKLSKVTGSREMDYPKIFLLQGGGKKREKGEAYILNEKRHIRVSDALKE